MNPHPRRIAAFICLGLSGCGMSGQLSQSDRDLRVADVELSSGAPQAALDIAASVVSRHPNDPAALVRLGQAQQALGQDDAATRSFERALGDDGGSFDARFGLARLHLKSDPSRALGELTNLAGTHPSDSRLQTDVGVAHDMLGQHEEAQSAYRQALESSPGLMAAQVDLGLSLALSNRAEQSLEILGPLADDGAIPRVREDYALAATLAGRADQARTVLGKDMSREQVALAMDAYRELQNPAP